jgi:hypothetical protein
LRVIRGIVGENERREKVAQANKDTESRKSLRVVTYWLFVVAVFSWVVPFTLMFVFSLPATAGDTGAAMAAALWPSLATLAVAVVLCVITYFIYRKVILKV